MLCYALVLHLARVTDSDLRAGATWPRTEPNAPFCVQLYGDGRGDPQWYGDRVCFVKIRSKTGNGISRSPYREGIKSFYIGVPVLHTPLLSVKAALALN